MANEKLTGGRQRYSCRPLLEPGTGPFIDRYGPHGMPARGRVNFVNLFEPFARKIALGANERRPKVLVHERNLLPDEAANEQMLVAP